MLQEIEQNLDKAIHHLEAEFGKLQMGRATPAIVEDIMVQQYGSMGPIKNTASINVLDPQTLSITPWDKELVVIIVKAITEANIGLNPQNMWDSIMIKVPQMTEERRKEMCKIVKKFAEDSKVSVRNMRADAHKTIKKQENDKEISEDIAKDLETDLQKKVDEVNKRIEEAAKHKEVEVMKV